jgi:VanZ like family
VDSLTTTQAHDEAAASPAPRPAGGAILKTIRIAMAAAWTLVIFALCWMPGEWVQEVGRGSPWFQIPDLDKVIHWGIFVLFTVLWLRTGTSRRRYAWVALGGLAVAALTEVGQIYLPVGRDGEVGDAITDLIGVAIGLGVARWIEPPFRWAESLVFGPRGA